VADANAQAPPDVTALGFFLYLISPYRLRPLLAFDKTVTIWSYAVCSAMTFDLDVEPNLRRPISRLNAHRNG
jgi:hypothetical protein